MQKPHRPVWACKLPRFMHRRIRLTVEMLGNSGLPIAMVPCLHQRIAYIKRKLRVWRAQKCNFLISTKAAMTTTGLQTTPFHASPYKTESGKSGLRLAMVLCLHQRIAYIKRKLRVWIAKKCVALVCRKTPPTCTGLQTTLFHVWQYWAENGNMLNFVPTNPHCTTFAPKQCLYQKEAVWRAQECIALVRGKTPPTCAGLQTTQFHGWQFGAENRNMRTFGPTNPHCTAFAPKQWLYQKESTGMESLKMYCPSRCRNRTYQCGATN